MRMRLVPISKFQMQILTSLPDELFQHQSEHDAVSPNNNVGHSFS